MSDDELHRQMIHAAEEFPVRGWSLDVQRRVVRRRRTAAGLAAAVGVVAAAGIAVAVPTVTGRGSAPSGPGAPASAATTSADYVGSSWRLTSVAQGATATTIPTGLGVRMELFPDGRMLAYDGVNTISARFTRSADGFEVRDVRSTAVGYVGSDPQVLAARAAFQTLAFGDPEVVTPSASCGDCHPRPGPARDTVVSADGTRLVVQAGALRLSFERTGPADANRPIVPEPSGKPS
jgi:hypothetical protein